MKTDKTNHDDLPFPELDDFPELTADFGDVTASLGLDCADLNEMLGLDHPTAEDYAYFVKEAAKATAKAAKSAAAIETLSKAKKSASVTLRIPGPVLAAFKRQAPKHGLGYQSLVNLVLKDAARGW